MARLKTVRIACDDCGAVRVSAPTTMLGTALHRLRAQLRSVGWVSDAAANTDTCQACVVGVRPTTELRAVR